MVILNPNDASGNELTLVERWEAGAVRNLIEEKRMRGENPVYLLLGRVEMEFLLEHLSDAFGPDSVTSTKDLYYMGLAVMEVPDKESLFRLAGKKNVSLADAYGRHSVSGPHRRIA